MRVPKAKTQTLNDNSFASHPGLVIPSWPKVRRLQPELFPSLLWKVQNRERWKIRRRFRVHIEEHLSNGDSRAAIVLTVEPYIVAAYTDELDCVALLRFPEDLSRELALMQGTRLLTVNTYYRREEEIAPDLLLGPGDLMRHGNFMPFIAEFYSDDLERITERKAAISEEEFRQAEKMGYEALRRGVTPRDGRPFRCFQPAKPKS